MLKDLLISEVRINILKTMLPSPDRQYHVRALVRAVSAEINAVRRELLRLERVGLLRKRKSSNRVYYAVDTSCMYYPELLALIGKEEGLGAQIINHAKELGDMKFAVLSREYLRGRDASVLDVDLFIVGKVNDDVLKRIVSEVEKTLGREINYTVMDEEDFLHRKRRNDNFVSRFMSQSRTMLIGDESEFCDL
jgi:DNA-binding transcriptional ArsR family regulator